MKIEFDPLNNEEKNEVKLYFKMGEYISALEEIHQRCRSQMKHGESFGEKADEFIENIRRLSGVVHD